MTAGSDLLIRAKSIIARSFYEQLSAAGYTPKDVIDVINHLMDRVTLGVGRDRNSQGPFPQTLDGETGLLAPGALLEVLDFELQRMVDGRIRTVAIAVVAVETAVDAAQDARLALHSVLSIDLERSLRTTDSAARLSEDEYVVVLPGADDRALAAVRRRLEASVERHAELRASVVWRGFVATDATQSADSLLAACRRISPQRPSTQRPSAKTASPKRELVLALGGGAARAAAHIGVLEGLTELGVPVAGIAGTSAGAIVGAMSASGMTPKQILERFEAFADASIYKELRRAYRRFAVDAAVVGDPYFRRSSLVFVSTKSLSAVDDALYAEFIEFFVGRDRPVDSLPIPFACCAADLQAGRSVVLSHGSLHRILQASCAVPGLFPPQPHGERTLVDGSALAEVPVTAARTLLPSHPVLAAYLVRPERAPVRYRNSAEVAVRTHAVVHTCLVQEQLRQSAFVLSLPAQDVGWLGFGRARTLASVGRTALLQARADIDVLRSE